MKLKLFFTVDNAAYQTPDGEGPCGFAIGETLRKVAWEIENQTEIDTAGGVISDTNGNTVGSWGIVQNMVCG